MKKLLALLLALTLCLSVLVLSLTSCELPAEVDEDGEEETGEEGGKEGGKEGDGAEVDSAETAKRKLLDFGKTTGYEFTMKTVAGGAEAIYSSGEKGNAWWVLNNGSGTAFVFGDPLTAIYQADEGEWSFESNVVGKTADDLFDIYAGLFASYIFNASNFVGSDDFRESGTETIAGRSCRKLTYSESVLSITTTCNAWVDKDLGITMKWEYTFTNGDESNTVSSEITSFKTGSAVGLPSLPEAGEDYMDLYGVLGVPDNDYTAMLPAIPGTVKMSSISDGTFSISCEGVSEDDFSAFLTALAGKGFSGDPGTSLVSWENGDGAEVVCMFSEGSLFITLKK